MTTDNVVEVSKEEDEDTDDMSKAEVRGNFRENYLKISPKILIGDNRSQKLLRKANSKLSRKSITTKNQR